ncbi:MAG TPA: hypothetical protein G4O04_05175 [Anaerolineae bacterium]|nr:hypothetical protein [Anaerolineae bacterium]HID83917.1 hypothetical protein [Anaerolineales bacterium]HIQ08862.1 hypothetical protein [Anaerolineaceae bacterium]
MVPKLTRRQQEFLGRFLDLYREVEEPIHYAEVAERLGIGRVTAYEMLRLLEERGLVRSRFHLPKGRRGPGRTVVLFSPTEKAPRVLRQLAGEAANGEDWEAIKAQILTRLREGKAKGYEQLLNDLLARLPERRSPLRYMAELITAILLALRSLLEGPYGRLLRQRLQRIGLPGELGLSALTGLGMALGLAKQVNRRVSTAILGETHRFQRTIQELSDENRRRLAEFAREVLGMLESH